MNATRSSGFARIELAFLVVISILVGVLLVAAGERSRRLARLGDDEAHLRQLASAIHTYAAEFNDGFPTFSWRQGPAPIPPGDPNGTGLFQATGNVHAAMNQMVYLMRTVAGRPEMPASANFIPHVSYSYLVLAQHAHLKLPTRSVVSSANHHRNLWANDPHGYDQGLYSPSLGTGLPGLRHPYTSDFRVPAAFWNGSPDGNLVMPSSHTNIYVIPSAAMLGPQPLSSVAFPSSKVMLSDYIARHFGPRLPYATAAEARLPQLMADGSVAVKSAGDANPGCNPNNGDPIAIPFSPSAIDPPATGANAGLMPGRFFWTRRGLSGRDYNGPEVPGF